jgi:hypothetical protein
VQSRLLRLGVNNSDADILALAAQDLKKRGVVPAA